MPKPCWKIVLFGLLVAGAARAQESDPAAPGSTAFVDVTVVPGDRERVLTGQTVVVTGGRIASIGPSGSAKVPANATRIESQGKFLMPGLADMHAHLRSLVPEETWEDWLKLWLASGVTTLREMDGSDRTLAVRGRIQRGELLGPRLFLYGPGFRGENTPSAAAAVEHVDRQKRHGYDGLKIYDGLSRETYQAIARTARRVKLPFAGHVPSDVGLLDSLAAGQASIEHLDGYLEALAGDPLIPPRDPQRPPPSDTSMFLVIEPAILDAVDEKKIRQLVAATRRAGAVVVPTLTEYQALFNDLKLETLRELPELKYMPPYFLALWKEQQGKQRPHPAAHLEKLMRLRRELTRSLAASGLVMLGSSTPGRFGVPGFALQHEVQALASAGLTPWQIFQAATLRPARYLGVQSESGTIAVGKRADLLLLEANPLADAGNLFRSAGVMVNGRWLPRAELDTLLADIARRMRFPSEREVKDLPIPAKDAQAVTGDYTFPGLKATMGIDLEKGELLVGNRDPARPGRQRLQAQGDGSYLLPDVSTRVTFELKNGRATTMTISSPGLWLDQKGARVPAP